MYEGSLRQAGWGVGWGARRGGSVKPSRPIPSHHHQPHCKQYKYYKFVELLTGCQIFPINLFAWEKQYHRPARVNGGD